MANNPPKPFATPEAIAQFQEYLSSSERILALCGAGLSASSGLPTFRGAGGMWKNMRAADLATPQAFQRDPAQVWEFYEMRRQKALSAKPNAAHYALAELARRKPGFLCLSQNVDGKSILSAVNSRGSILLFVSIGDHIQLKSCPFTKPSHPVTQDLLLITCCFPSAFFTDQYLTPHVGLSPRANHPPSQLKLLHGNLFDLKCFNPRCSYFEANNFTPHLIPVSPGSKYSADNSSTPPSQAPSSSNSLTKSQLPHCPSCKTNLLRPGVVWFGEPLSTSLLSSIDQWIVSSSRIDLMLVIGTTAEVYPAAGYIELARSRGARVAVVNIEEGKAEEGLGEEDWAFVGDAAVVVPRLFERVVGKLTEYMPTETN
jgi:NAD-dependent deacetylase sirtuin 5